MRPRKDRLNLSVHSGRCPRCGSHARTVSTERVYPCGLGAAAWWHRRFHCRRCDGKWRIRYEPDYVPRIEVDDA